jgi:chaperonin GroES
LTLPSSVSPYRQILSADFLLILPSNIGGLMSLTVKPLQDRVLIKRLEEETKTVGGIIIPDNHKEKPAQGEVMAVGAGYRLQDGSVKALDVKKGDKVLFGKYSGTEVKVAGENYIIMKEDEIFGILQ